MPHQDGVGMSAEPVVPGESRPELDLWLMAQYGSDGWWQVWRGHTTLVLENKAQACAVRDALNAVARRPALPAPPACPECQAPLKAVRYPGGALNKDQWESVRAGDWFCDSTVMHAQLRQDGNVYFWNREVAALPAPEPPLLDLSRINDEGWDMLAGLTGRELGATLRQLAKAQTNGDA